MSIHEACYSGNVGAVAAMLRAGTSPNLPADPGQNWVSCAGPAPRPLNCVAIAWTLTEQHLDVARLLIEYGAIVDKTVVRDHEIEMCLTPIDRAFRELLRAATRFANPDLYRHITEGDALLDALPSQVKHR
jgi:hypothetical protein